jgi:hypothetical protein
LTVRFAVAAVVALAAIFGLMGNALADGHKDQDEHGNNGKGHTPVTLCHWVPAHGSSYITINVDDDGSRGNKNLQGHAGHEKDIIPAPPEGCPDSETPTETPNPTETSVPPTASSTSTATNTPVKTPPHKTVSPTSTNTPTDGQGSATWVVPTSARVIRTSSTSVPGPVHIIALPNAGSGDSDGSNKYPTWILLAAVVGSVGLAAIGRFIARSR